VWRPAHRRMELRYALDLGGFPHRLPSYTQLCRGTLLGNDEFDVTQLVDTDAYVLTHLLFYLADMGRRPLAFLPRPVVARARRLVRLLLSVYLRRRNWDIVGELLVAARCTGDTSFP